MTITIKKLAVIFGIIFMAIFIANHFIAKSINNMKRGGAPAGGGEARTEAVKNDVPAKGKISKPTETREWKKVDEEKLAEIKKKYGIKVRPKNYGPSTDEEWSEYVEKKVTDSPMFESDGAQAAIKTIQVNEQEYEATMQVNKDHEEIVKELLSQDPNNKDYKERLQNIYKLRAIGKALKSKVVVDGNTIVMDEITTVPDKM